MAKSKVLDVSVDSKEFTKAQHSQLVKIGAEFYTNNSAGIWLDEVDLSDYDIASLIFDGFTVKLFEV